MDKLFFFAMGKFGASQALIRRRSCKNREAEFSWPDADVCFGRRGPSTDLQL